MSPARQTGIGLTLAGGMIASWLALHVYSVFFHRLTSLGWAVAPVMILVQAWLGVGLFIVAHDAMHGSLAPGRPRLNATIGQLTLGLYAGFRFRPLNTAHHQHHRTPGAAEDPDFHAGAPTAFVPWFLQFFRRYFGWPEFAALTVVLALYLLVLRVSPLNAALFWGLPAILSALQLFTFGTWLPHRHEAHAFADHHNARSLGYPWLLSLLTCFHFGGFHHQHHLSPGTPWWWLPSVRA